jgi:hypothetical protein
MARRACVVFLLAAIAVGGSAVSAIAHVPWKPGHRAGCVTANDIWTEPGSARDLLAPKANENTCGNNVTP